MKYNKNLLSDEAWERIEPLIPVEDKSYRFGRPRADCRKVVEGIIWVLKTGARWRDLPKEYPNGTTCWRRLKDWEAKGIWESLWRRFLSELDAEGLIEWEEASMDAAFAPAKKGAMRLGKPSGAKARK